MRGSIALVVTAWVLSSVAPAQPPRANDPNERLVRRLEETINAQSKVLEDIRELLAESLKNTRNAEVERAQLEMRAEVETLKAKMATQAAEVVLMKKDLDLAKQQVDNLDNRNRALQADSETLRSEIASQALLRQRLQNDVSQLRVMLEDEKKKNVGTPKPAPKPGGDRKDG